MKKLFVLLASVFCIFAVSSCSLLGLSSSSTATSFSYEMYVCTQDNFDTFVQPYLTVCALNPTASNVNSARNGSKDYSVCVIDTTTASRSELYNLLTSKGFTSYQATNTLNNAPSIVTVNTTNSDYPKGWIYIKANY